MHIYTTLGQTALYINLQTVDTISQDCFRGLRHESLHFAQPRLLSYFRLLRLNYRTRHSPSAIHKEFLTSLITYFGSRSCRETNEENTLSIYNVVPNVKVATITRYCKCSIWNGYGTVERRTMTSLHFC